MTYEEALIHFEGELEGGKCSETCHVCNAHEIAIKAIRKMIELEREEQS